jgi:hypothetical protein
MRVFGPLLTVLLVTIALLLGAVGGASAHAVLADHHSTMPVDHSAPAADHDQGQAPCNHCPGRAGGQGMPMAAPCCPGLTAPARVQVVRLTAVRRVAWHPVDVHSPGSRLIAPEPPPPKTLL